MKAALVLLSLVVVANAERYLCGLPAQTGSGTSFRCNGVLDPFPKKELEVDFGDIFYGDAEGSYYDSVTYDIFTVGHNAKQQALFVDAGLTELALNMQQPFLNTSTSSVFLDEHKNIYMFLVAGGIYNDLAFYDPAANTLTYNYTWPSPYRYTPGTFTWNSKLRVVSAIFDYFSPVGHLYFYITLNVDTGGTSQVKVDGINRPLALWYLAKTDVYYGVLSTDGYSPTRQVQLNTFDPSFGGTSPVKGAPLINLPHGSTFTTTKATDDNSQYLYAFGVIENAVGYVVLPISVGGVPRDSFNVSFTNSFFFIDMPCIHDAHRMFC